MPISLPPIGSEAKNFRPSRRRFLAGSLATAAGLFLQPRSLPSLWAADAPATAPSANPDRFALLSDIHIAADRKLVVRDANMFDNLQRVSAEVTDRRPAAVFIDGDLAYLHGEAEDYAMLVDLLKPLRQAGLPIHLTMGNHDSREHFWAALPEEDAARKDPRNRPLNDRQAMALETAHANWFILDSLEKTNSTPGLVGGAQLKWLTTVLDKAADKPALVMVHHNPDSRIPGSGLRDTAALMEAILPRKQVKVLFFGHTHDWHVKQQDGLHLVNFPPVAYVFTPGKPNGWVEGTLAERGMMLQLHCLDKKHAQSEQTVKLEWRA